MDCKEVQKKLHDNVFIDAEGRIFWKKKGVGRKVDIPLGTITKNGYRSVGFMGKKYYAHRLIWIYYHGNIKSDTIDHINGNRDDNRIENLRNVSTLDNLRNTKKSSQNKSGVVGVCYDKSRDKWRAFISVKNKVISLGRFDEKEDAINCRMEANKKYGFHELHGT